MSSFNRREFLKLSALVGVTTLLHACSASVPFSEENADTHILIIGAGVSGLAAARQLRASGMQVTVLEGRDRIGGRIWTNRDLGLPIDLGASWIHGERDNPITKLAKDLGIRRVVTDEDEGWLYDANGQALSDAKITTYETAFEEILEAASEWAEERDNDVSVAAAVNAIVAEYGLDADEVQALRWAMRSLENSAGADMSAVSMWWGDEDEGFAGDDVLFPEGYAQIINALAEGIDVRLGQTVQSIAYDDGVMVKTSSDTFTADSIIVTLPLGVLKAGSVSFSPTLPKAKQKAIQSGGFGLLNKVVLRFPRVFWQSDASYLEFLAPENALLQEFLNLAPVTDEPILMAFIGGSRGETLETLSESAIVAEAMKLLRSAYGAGIPEPTDVLISNWRADPFARGSYAHMPVGGDYPDIYKALAESVDDIMFFAGEATHHQYPATVHGAYLSGIRAAEEVTWEYGGKNSKSFR